MANTYTELLYHCVFSTKQRQRLIRPEIEERVWALVAGTARAHGMKAVRVGGVEDHVHVLLAIPKTISVAEAMKRLKGGSSAAVSQSGLMDGAPFGWQDGYAAFTVSASAVEAVTAYIAGQREHHTRRTFEEEYVAFLEKHGVSFDPRYLFD